VRHHQCPTATATSLFFIIIIHCSISILLSS
jgi:hypothetical protein